MDTSDQLSRFLVAQEPVYAEVVAELRAHRKRTHWMWFIFPQLQGLGMSPTSQYYGITSLPEAEAYLTHEILGARLLECAALVLAATPTPMSEMFGFPDDAKLRSCMTLFERVSGAPVVFGQVLDAAYNGSRDEKTLDILRLMSK